MHLGGNIGRALLPIIETIREEDAGGCRTVQLSADFHAAVADVAVVTNVAPNHLDVHKDMEEYIGAKKEYLSAPECFFQNGAEYG